MSHLLVVFLLILLLNYAVFLIAYKQQTDQYTDITYAVSFLVVAVFSFFSVRDFSTSKCFLFIMVALWSLRLGIYMRSRIIQEGEDVRFTNIRPYFGRFFRFFTIQGIGICLISLPVIVGFQKELYPNSQYSWIKFAGTILIIAGFVIEAIADHQKSQFWKTEKSKHQFIDNGLYAYIRYPNYLGEIMFWSGIFIFVSPFLVGFEFLSIISPIFITILLVYISGIRILEISLKDNYGHLDTYKDYVSRSWRLIPFVY